MRNHRNLSIARWSDICHIHFWGEWRNFCLKTLPNADAIFPKSKYGIYQTTLQCLSSYDCAIIVLYVLLWLCFLHKQWMSLYLCLCCNTNLYVRTYVPCITLHIMYIHINIAILQSFCTIPIMKAGKCMYWQPTL